MDIWRQIKVNIIIIAWRKVEYCMYLQCIKIISEKLFIKLDQKPEIIIHYNSTSLVEIYIRILSYARCISSLCIREYEQKLITFSC